MVSRRPFLTCLPLNACLHYTHMPPLCPHACHLCLPPPCHRLPALLCPSCLPALFPLPHLPCRLFVLFLHLWHGGIFGWTDRLDRQDWPQDSQWTGFGFGLLLSPSDDEAVCSQQLIFFLPSTRVCYCFSGWHACCAPFRGVPASPCGSPTIPQLVVTERACCGGRATWDSLCLHRHVHTSLPASFRPVYVAGSFETPTWQTSLSCCST